MKAVILEGKNICREYAENKTSEVILNGLSTKIYEGDFTVIMGPSGAGKSTLLYALSGMDRITSGAVIYKEREISNLDEKKMAGLRAGEFGFVFQQTHLVSNLTLLENVSVAGYVGGKLKQGEVLPRAEELLDQMEVKGAKDRLPSQVSGGEAQRAAIARALMNEPGIIFADEPTGALNKSNTEKVLKLLTDVHKSGQSILMVTHDVHAAARGNRLLYLEDGQIAGEKTLPVFDENGQREREQQISQWLTDLAW